jgi:hypothetical protein
VWDAGAVLGTVTLFAHQGGWDEVLFVLVPIALFAGLLAVANRRASRDLAEQQAHDHADENEE